MCRAPSGEPPQSCCWWSWLRARSASCSTSPTCPSYSWPSTCLAGPWCRPHSPGCWSWSAAGPERLSQPAELLGQGGRGVVGVQPAGVGQHPHPGLAEGSLLRTDHGLRLLEGGPVRRDAQDSQPLRSEATHLLAQQPTPLDDLRAAQLVGPRRRPRGDVGDPETQPQQLVLLGGQQLPWREPGAVQRRPEPVAGPGEVVPGQGRDQTGVDAGEEHPQSGRDHVRDGPGPGRLEVRATHQRSSSGSSATATNSSERYMLDQWNSLIGRSATTSSSPDSTARRSSRCDSTRHAPPRSAPAGGEDQPVPATGHSSSEVATITYEYATIWRATARAPARTGSIGTSAAA